MKNITEAAILLNQVNFQANDLHIIKNISGSFTTGRITTLVGPSGAGKTTLLKMCNGLLSPSSGTITINNQPIDSYEPTSLRRLVGMALQAAPMIPGTIFDNLALPRKLQHQELSEEEAISYLEDVGLDKDFLLYNIEDLSGGQRQKVSIARTLINQSAILLLDEITSALDPTSIHDIEQLILSINKKYATTIIWITHNIEQAMTIGHETWILIDGELIECGKSNLLQTSHNPRVQQFVQGVLT